MRLKIPFVFSCLLVGILCQVDCRESSATCYQLQTENFIASDTAIVLDEQEDEADDCVQRACQIHRRIERDRDRSAATIIVVKMTICDEDVTIATANPGAKPNITRKKKPTVEKPERRERESDESYAERCEEWEQNGKAKGEEKPPRMEQETVAEYRIRCQEWEDATVEYARKLKIFLSKKPTKPGKALDEWNKCQKDFESSGGFPNTGTKKEVSKFKKDLIAEAKKNKEILICNDDIEVTIGGKKFKFTGLAKYKFNYRLCSWPHAEDVIETIRLQTAGEITGVGICRRKSSCDFSMCPRCEENYGDEWDVIPQEIEKKDPNTG